MEYVDGGTLTNYVTKRASNRNERGGLYLVEDEARYFFRVSCGYSDLKSIANVVRLLPYEL